MTYLRVVRRRDRLASRASSADSGAGPAVTTALAVLGLGGSGGSRRGGAGGGNLRRSRGDLGRARRGGSRLVAGTARGRAGSGLVEGRAERTKLDVRVLRVIVTSVSAMHEA